MDLEKALDVAYEDILNEFNLTWGEGSKVSLWHILPPFQNKNMRFRKSVGLRSVFALLAQNCMRCIALTKHFPAG